MTGEPPLESGADHETVTCESPIVPVTPLGGPGTGVGISEPWMRTLPALVPAPSLRGAPMATAVPPADNANELPDRSSSASPTMRSPEGTQNEPDHTNTRTCPGPGPGAPTASRDPSADRATAAPDWSFAASPSTSGPIGSHVDPDHE